MELPVIQVRYELRKDTAFITIHRPKETYAPFAVLTDVEIVTMAYKALSKISEAQNVIKSSADIIFNFVISKDNDGYQVKLATIHTDLNVQSAIEIKVSEINDDD